MVYYHIDQVQQDIQSLGFNNVNNRAIEVNIDGTTEDNSFYSPMTKSLTFGTGGVDDAEDSETSSCRVRAFHSGQPGARVRSEW